MLESKTFKRVKIRGATSLIEYAQKLPKHLGASSIDAGIDLGNAPETERQLLKEFKRRAHFYVNSLPTHGDVLGWFALMQHYGAPTRLLDWTYSVFRRGVFCSP
jgi:hypothetical protein